MLTNVPKEENAWIKREGDTAARPLVPPARPSWTRGLGGDCGPPRSHVRTLVPPPPGTDALGSYDILYAHGCFDELLHIAICNSPTSSFTPALYMRILYPAETTTSARVLHAQHIERVPLRSFGRPMGTHFAVHT